MKHLNKLIGTAIETFGIGMKEGGCGAAVERTDRYLEELEHAANGELHHEVKLLEDKINEQREALTLLMRHQQLTGYASASHQKAKLIPININKSTEE